MTLTLAATPVPLTTDADGVVRVAGTRVTLDVVVTAFLEGATAEEIAQQYPVLPLAEVYAVIGYYLHDQASVDDYLRDLQHRRAGVRAENERRHPPEGLRSRLLARRRVSV